MPSIHMQAVPEREHSWRFDEMLTFTVKVEAIFWFHNRAREDGPQLPRISLGLG